MTADSQRRNWEQRRRPMNEESLPHAHHHHQYWEEWQISLILDWDHSDDQLQILAEMLGRTCEAVRTQYYNVLRGGWHLREQVDVIRTVTRTTTTTTTTYCYKNWPEEERSEWYR